MSKLARTLVFAATLAAMNLAGLTAVAHAQSNDDPDGKDARRPPTERQVGETWREHQATPQQQAATDDAVEQFRRGERAAQGQSAADAAVQRQLARERHSIPSGTPAQVPTPAPAEPNGQPGWLLASLGVLTIVLALVGGLAVLAARRASRRARLGHAA
jgi:cell division septation protein DedD